MPIIGRRTAVKTLGLSLLATGARPHPPWRSRPPAPASLGVLTQLEGRWEGTGVILGQASRVQMEWARALDGRFMRLTFVSHIGPGAQDAALRGPCLLPAPAGEGRFRATWFDSSGLVRPIVATATATREHARGRSGARPTPRWARPPTGSPRPTAWRSWTACGPKTAPGASSAARRSRVHYETHDRPAGRRSGAARPARPARLWTSVPRPFAFTGSGGEYFRIWIVNLLLSVITLGIYSAWAKVRRLRYFYGHTSVAGGTFGYHASPIAILKGRLIAYAVVFVLAVLGTGGAACRQRALLPAADADADRARARLPVPRGQLVVRRHPLRLRRPRSRRPTACSSSGP